MIDRNIKKPLYLRSVQIDGQNSLGTACGYQIRDQLRRDRNTRTVFLIRTCITEIRNNRRHTFCRRPDEGVYHYQQFHQMLIGRRARRLDDKNIHPADILADLKVELAIRKAVGARLAKIAVQMRRRSPPPSSRWALPEKILMLPVTLIREFDFSYKFQIIDFKSISI